MQVPGVQVGVHTQSLCAALDFGWAEVLVMEEQVSCLTQADNEGLRSCVPWTVCLYACSSLQCYHCKPSLNFFPSLPSRYYAAAQRKAKQFGPRTLHNSTCKSALKHIELHMRWLGGGHAPEDRRKNWMPCRWFQRMRGTRSFAFASASWLTAGRPLDSNVACV